ncbi:unnamed protein product [Ostreobium quekettii]|uniref:Kinesin-like protein n=1 Tax=Ostreobium quekettii TaxID=121088 RepID=A0A8S1IMH7_9CHLO|nr:unnamed protein product [Ostreobium quekettii]
MAEEALTMAGSEPTGVEVAMRVRPSHGADLDWQSCNVAVVPGDQGSSLLVRSGSRPEAGMLQKYCFPHVFENAEQEDVYMDCARAVVASVSKGYNASILAYGVTGAGKSYTMLGSDPASILDKGRQGVVPRAIMQVFEDLEEMEKWSVNVTFVEIYNETIVDLLHPDQKDISVKDTSCKSNYVAGGCMTFKNVELEDVRSAEEALNHLKKGMSHLHSTENGSSNLRSARAHTIFTLWLETEIDGRNCHSKLNLVDLAGSERLWKTNPKTGALMKEAAFVNRSIGVLSMVAKELKRKMPYVPFGDCKLTHFLKDSIGGNCRTLLIACVFGDESHLRDTLSTCRFAEDLQQIGVHPQRYNVAGSATSQATLYRSDPLAMKCLEKMSELRASQQMQRYLRARSRKREKCASKALQVKPQEQPDQSLSQVLNGLRKQVQIFEKRQKDWEDKHAGGTQHELRLLQEKVQELEAKLSKGSGSSRSSRPEGPTGAWDRSLEVEVHRLQAKVEQLDKVCYLREQELEELNHLREHVLHQQPMQRTQSMPLGYGTPEMQQELGGMHPGSGMQRMVAVHPMAMGGMPAGMPGMQPMVLSGMPVGGMQGHMAQMHGRSPLGMQGGMHGAMHSGSSIHGTMHRSMQRSTQRSTQMGMQGGAHSAQFVHGFGGMGMMAGMHGIPYTWQEEGVETPDSRGSSMASRGGPLQPVTGPSGRWGHTHQNSASSSTLLGGGSSNQESDLFSEAKGYLLDPDSSDSSWQQYLPPDPRAMGHGTPPPLHPQQRMVGMTAPSGIARCELGVAPSRSSQRSEGASSTSQRAEKSKQKKKGGFVRKVTRLLGIGVTSKSECQDESDAALSYCDTFDELEHTQVRDGWIPTQPMAPVRSHPISSNGFANYPEPTSLFLDSDASSQMMMNEDARGHMPASPCQRPRAYDLPKLDLGRVRS